MRQAFREEGDAEALHAQQLQALLSVAGETAALQEGVAVAADLARRTVAAVAAVAGEFADEALAIAEQLPLFGAAFGLARKVVARAQGVQVGGPCMCGPGRKGG